jgi:hypothetical protein
VKLFIRSEPIEVANSEGGSMRIRASVPPMTLQNMRANGVRMVIAQCETCGHKADLNVDALPETVKVPKAGQRLRCSRCGGKKINTRPAWHTTQRAGVPDYRRSERS